MKKKLTVVDFRGPVARIVKGPEAVLLQSVRDCLVNPTIPPRVSPVYWELKGGLIVVNFERSSSGIKPPLATLSSQRMSQGVHYKKLYALSLNIATFILGACIGLLF